MTLNTLEDIKMDYHKGFLKGTNKYPVRIIDIDVLIKEIIVPWILNYRKYKLNFPNFDLAVMEMFNLEEEDLDNKLKKK